MSRFLLNVLAPLGFLAHQLGRYIKAVYSIKMHWWLKKHLATDSRNFSTCLTPAWRTQLALNWFPRSGFKRCRFIHKFPRSSRVINLLDLATHISYYLTAKGINFAPRTCIIHFHPHLTPASLLCLLKSDLKASYWPQTNPNYNAKCNHWLNIRKTLSGLTWKKS